MGNRIQTNLLNGWLLLVLCCSTALAELPAERTDQLSGGNSPASNGSTPEDPLVLARQRFARLQPPAAGDAQALSQYLAEIKLNRPRSTAERLVLKEKISQAAELILASGVERQSATYRNAEFELMDAASVLIGSRDAKKQASELDRIVKYLRSRPRLGIQHAMLANVTANGLESAGSGKLAAKAYSIFQTVFRDSQVGGRLQKRFENGAKRTSLIGKKITLEGRSLDGHTINLTSYRGKIVLIDFWATWCQPCLEAHDDLAKLHRRHRQSGFEILGVSLDTDREKLANYLEKQAAPWPTLHEAGNAGRHPFADRCGVETLPAMLLIDPQGVVIALESHPAKIAEILKKQLEE